MLSADFLDSYYCVEVELNAALAQVESSEDRVVGVVIRPCDWKRTSLGEFVGLPKDGKSVVEWSNPDLAFLNVVEEIRRLKMLSGLKSEPKIKETSNLELTPQWENYLNSTEIAFSHPRKKDLDLSDVFVSPHLKQLSLKSNGSEYSSIEEILSDIEQDPYRLILGGSQSGKTTLLKRCFTNALSNGFFPLVLNCKEINSTGLKKVCNSPVKRQYRVSNFDKFVENTERRVVFLLDNFEEIRLNRRHQTQLIEKLKAVGCGVVITGEPNLEYVEPECLSEAAGFNPLRIKEFGHVKRLELIKKWVQLGRQETIDEVEEVRQVNKFERQVNDILRKNLVPPRPLYVLSILQSLDAFTVNDYKLTSYGHCYNFLIQQALQNGSIKIDELDAFINLLTNLAFYVLEEDCHVFSKADWAKFSAQYGERYLIPEGALRSLLETKILRERDEGYQFAHKYIYFYYAGKYLAEELERGNGLDRIELLCSDMHLEQNANILIFTTHHTKSTAVIEQIALYADESFVGRRPAKLDSESTKFLAKRREDIPELVLEARSFEEERRRRAESKDRLDDAVSDSDVDDNEGFENNQVFKDINRSAKTIEIVGQIIRNRYGSLTRQEIRDLLESAVWAGLRFMDFFVELMCNAEDDLLEMIASAVSASEEPLSEAQKKNRAKYIYTRLCYGGVLGILLKIANAVGHKQVREMVQNIEKEHPDFVSVKLIGVALELEFATKFPKDKLKSINKYLAGNVVADRLFKEVVVNHLYLNFVERQDKQWIASEIGIPIADQNRIEGSRGTKRFPKKYE